MHLDKNVRLCLLTVGLLLGVVVACGPPQPDATTVEETDGPPNGEEALVREEAVEREPLVREVPPWSQSLAMLEDPRAGTRDRVASIVALGDSVVDALREVQSPLIEMLDHPVPDVGLAAENTIRRIRDDIASALVAASEEPRRRPGALRLLGGMTVSEERLDILVERMHSEDYRTRLRAVKVGGVLAAQNPGALDVLRIGMVDAEAGVRIEALEAVATMGPNAAARVEEVVSALDDDGSIAVCASAGTP